MITLTTTATAAPAATTWTEHVGFFPYGNGSPAVTDPGTPESAYPWDYVVDPNATQLPIGTAITVSCWRAGVYIYGGSDAWYQIASGPDTGDYIYYAFLTGSTPGYPDYPIPTSIPQCGSGTGGRSSNHKYCAGRTDPSTSTGQIGRSDVNFNPCMTVTDEYNGTKAISETIQPPADSRKHGGCPTYVFRLGSSLGCQVTKTSSYSSGSGVVDQVTMSLFWTESIPISYYEGNCVVNELQTDTMTMKVTTSATGKRSEASSVIVDYAPPPDTECF